MTARGSDFVGTIGVKIIAGTDWPRYLEVRQYRRGEWVLAEICNSAAEWHGIYPTRRDALKAGRAMVRSVTARKVADLGK